ncbi:GHKL domain-containing protein [Polaribacter pectinis]|uniref:histidine kinase n=1 Tax=Polaribacter pectinis TaxID=2738844 RepID=A0A7G9LE56_9FLAO|nr:ATP-binding protein [Polaribacter pectinis]QNM86905.1 GHKL domain-containing protein [Polaribacter pectinis]
MNSLLKRQIRKYLPKELQSNTDLNLFLDAINRSYDTSDEQFAMLQRATAISSEELFHANQKLEKDSNSQKEVIVKLKEVINTLKSYDLETKNTIENTDLDSLELVDFIDRQSKKIIKINKQRDILLQNLERQNQELNDYTHMVSHDLKSPLQSIDALTTWIKEDYSSVLDDTGKENLELIKDNVEKMDTLVKGILEYSTIGNAVKDLYQIDLNELVKNTLLELKIPNRIEVIFNNKLPTIEGDQFRLKKLFSNLISNAVKFNDKSIGFIEIGFEDKNEFWQFYVKDNGKGIDNQYLEKIFIAFQKLENDYKSVGIGLSIAKKIVEVYQGEIWIESEVDKGSIFYFTIKK